MSEKKEISAVIVNRNSRELLEGCLISLRAAASAPVTEIIVVDNASEDGSAAMVRERFPEARLLVNDHNAGFAAANNQALKYATGRYILLLNNDISFKGDLPGALRSFLEEHPAVSMAGPRLLRGDGSLQVSVYPRPGVLHSLLKFFRAYLFMSRAARARFFSGQYHDYSVPGRVDRLSGACIMVRAAAIAEVGPLDEDFFFYGEVHDWCWRMQKAGWEIWYYPGAEAVHYGGRSSAAQWDRERRHRLMLAATFKLYSKHFSCMKKWMILFLELLCSASAWVLKLPFPGPAAERAGVETRWYGCKIWTAVLKRKDCGIDNPET